MHGLMSSSIHYLNTETEAKTLSVMKKSFNPKGFSGLGE